MPRAPALAFALAVVAACGSDDGPSGQPAIDAGADAPLGPCDPLAPAGQQSCPVAQRCAWVIDSGPPGRAVGHLGCVPDGTLPLGASCTPTAGGEPDRCTTGLVCAGGTCKDVCGFDGGASSGCEAGQRCARHADLFASPGSTPLLGACTPGCEPLTQEREGGGRCPEGQGCYLVTSATETVAVCAAAGTGTHGQDLSGAVYANACVPGAQPRQKATGSPTVQCGGLCKPVDVTSTTARASEGGLAPDSCALRWGAAAPDDGGLGESCRYWSGREPFAGGSPYSHTVGWCFKHVAFQYDSDGDGAADTSFPRCAGLTQGDVVPPIGTPPHDDARYFWCVAPTAPRGPTAVIPQVLTDRLAP